jgi:hypothetical protein
MITVSYNKVAALQFILSLPIVNFKDKDEARVADLFELSSSFLGGCSPVADQSIIPAWKFENKDPSDQASDSTNCFVFNDRSWTLGFLST